MQTSTLLALYSILVTPIIHLPPVQQKGLASFYGAGEKHMHGKITASGEPFNSSDLTCASRTLPLGSVVVVEDVSTGAWTYCRVNDRGPYGARIRPEYGGGWAMMYPTKGRWAIRRLVDGVWQKAQYFDKKPGRYRGVMDMSYGTALALGVNTDAGLNKVHIRYWHSRYGFSPYVSYYRAALPISVHDPLMCF